MTVPLSIEFWEVRPLPVQMHDGLVVLLQVQEVPHTKSVLCSTSPSSHLPAALPGIMSWQSTKDLFKYEGHDITFIAAEPHA